jgi:alpha 1,3-glucosidase
MEHPSTVIVIPTQNVDELKDEVSYPNILPECEAHNEHHYEQLHNDLSMQLKAKEYVYIPRDWALTKLDQIKATSTLAVKTCVVPESVKAVENVLSMEIKTSDDQVATMELHFFEDGIVKFNCINPCNPSKFSFELIEKPANLTAYSLAGKVILEANQVEVTMTEVQAKVVVKFDSFITTLVSTKTDEVLLEINANNSLKFDENLTADFTFYNEYLYGLPERACNLVLEDTKAELPYRFYNQDVPAYPLNSKNALYGTVPIIISRSKKSSALVTMYWQNTSDTYIDIHKTAPTTQAYWLSERGNLECYIFVSHSNAIHYKAQSNMFGHCVMPQYFSLGYHQCRWSYKDQNDVLHVNDKFNENEIPCDTITLDIDHTDGCRYFTWNEDLFPDTVAMQQALVNDGRQLVTIADPHIKVDETYHVYQEAMEKGLVVRTCDNEPFVGKCWPGDSVYLDFLNEETRNHWASQYRYDKYQKSTPNVWAWNDMNEPSVFEFQGNHMPQDNIQTFKSLAEPEKSFQVEHREVHNIYGYCQHKATFDGMVKRNECQNIRPHVLSRSFYAGSQKWTTIWTGDTGATWDYLKVTVPQMLSLSLCGLSNVGGDVGGFLGDPEPELAVRWYQLGTFMPYFRGHSEITTKRREPWLYEKKYYAPIKESIKERYKLLPYWYTAFEEHCRTDVPLLRPVWFDQDIVSEDETMLDQERFMVGDGLLVVPILERKVTSIKGALKGLQGRWYDYYSKREMFGDEELKTGLERIGCFVKGGKIIPTYDIKTTIKSSKDAKESNIHLFVALDEQENAEGKMYFDDGETFDYKKGAFMRKTMTFNKDTLTWEGAEGSEYTLNNSVTKVIITGANPKFENAYLVKDDQERQKIQLTKCAGYLMVEFASLANKNWKIVLE